jgi:hypothetical protein
MERGPLRIVIAGRGCGACRELLRRTREACAALSLPAEIGEVLEAEALERYGVEHLPALFVEGRLVCQGFLPSPALLADWLGEIYRAEPPPPGGSTGNGVPSAGQGTATGKEEREP